MQEAAALTLAVSAVWTSPAPGIIELSWFWSLLFWSSSSLMLVGDPELPGRVESALLMARGLE